MALHRGWWIPREQVVVPGAGAGTIRAVARIWIVEHSKGRSSMLRLRLLMTGTGKATLIAGFNNP